MRSPSFATRSQFAAPEDSPGVGSSMHMGREEGPRTSWRIGGRTRTYTLIFVDAIFFECCVTSLCLRLTRSLQEGAAEMHGRQNTVGIVARAVVAPNSQFRSENTLAPKKHTHTHTHHRRENSHTHTREPHS